MYAAGLEPVEREISEIADVAHQATSLREFRDEALLRLERFLGLDYSLFWSLDCSPDVAIRGFDASFWSRFVEESGLYGPDMARLREWASLDGGVMIDVLRASPHELDELVFYQNIVRPIGARALGQALVGRPERPIAIISFGRTGQMSTPLGAEHAALMRRFLPVLTLGNLAHTVPTSLVTAVSSIEQREVEARVRTRALSKRERELLELFAAGASYAEAASALAMSINTVRQHVRNLYEKLGVSSKTEAVLRGLGGQADDQRV